jgi:hypothetical protein
LDFVRTAYGVVSDDDGRIEVHGTHVQLQAWATRPGSSWPCSVLAQCASVTASFDSWGDLVDLNEIPAVEIPANELNAWISDALRAAGVYDHPAVKP